MEDEKSFQDRLDEEFEEWFWSKFNETKDWTPAEKLAYWESIENE